MNRYNNMHTLFLIQESINSSFLTSYNQAKKANICLYSLFPSLLLPSIARPPANNGSLEDRSFATRCLVKESGAS